MTKREHLIGATVYSEIFSSAAELNPIELLQLREAYTKKLSYMQLPDNLQQKFFKMGVRVIERLTKL